MELLNELYAAEQSISAPVMAQVLEKVTLVLEPFAPYLAEEMWEELGRTGPLFRQTWPAFDAELAREDQAQIVIQVNGKLRGRISVPFGTSKEALKERALADPSVRSWIEGKQIVNVIVVPDKLVNIVVR